MVPVRSEPLGIAFADVLHGLIQHLLGNQLVHERVCQVVQCARPVRASLGTELLLQPMQQDSIRTHSILATNFGQSMGVAGQQT